MLLGRIHASFHLTSYLSFISIHSIYIVCYLLCEYFSSHYCTNCIFFPAGLSHLSTNPVYETTFSEPAQWLPSISLFKTRRLPAPFTLTSLAKRSTTTTLFSCSNPMARLTITQHRLHLPARPLVRIAPSLSVLLVIRRPLLFPTLLEAASGSLSTEL